MAICQPARQKVKVECATKLRTELAPPLYIGPLWAPSHSPSQSPSPVPGRARNGASLLASVYTLARTLLVIPANKTFIAIGYSGYVSGHRRERSGVLLASYQKIEMQMAETSKLSILLDNAQAASKSGCLCCPTSSPSPPACLSVCLSGRLCLHMSAACRSAPVMSKLFGLAEKCKAAAAAVHAR